MSEKLPEITAFFSPPDLWHIPSVRFAPATSNPHPSDGYVAVYFFIGKDNGTTKYEPHVTVHCQLKSLSPQEARLWADILRIASDFAAERPSPSWNASIGQAWVQAREYLAKEKTA